MKYIEEVLADDEADFQVINAFAFDPHFVFAVLSAQTHESRASALLRIPISRPESFEVLLEFNLSTLDYAATSEDEHFVLASGGFLNVLRGGSKEYYDYPIDSFLYKIAPVPDGTLFVYGEQGVVMQFENGHYTRVPTPTEEDLRGGHFPLRDRGFICGDYGTLLAWDGKAFSKVELGRHPFLLDVHQKPDGTILMTGEEGDNFVLNNDELFELEGLKGNGFAVSEWRKTEYWGDDVFGVYSRAENKLTPRFETLYAFAINPSPSALCINGGNRIYVTDGEKWSLLRLKRNPNQPLETAEIDFIP